MLINFSSTLLICGTTVYIVQGDFSSFALLTTLGVLSRMASFSIEHSDKNGKQDVKKKREVLQEQIH